MNGVQALRVPGHTQPDKEPECLLYAMWMALQFVQSAYPSEPVRSAIPVLTPHEMRDYITIRNAGWSPDPSDLNALSEETEPVTWELKWWNSTIPKTALFDIINDGLDNTLPTIVVLDAMSLRELNRRGPLHAVVAVGLGDHDVVINDPWGSMFEVFPRDRVADAWDTTLNRVITIDLSTQATLNETITQEENSE